MEALLLATDCVSDSPRFMKIPSNLSSFRGADRARLSASLYALIASPWAGLCHRKIVSLYNGNQRTVAVL